VLCLWFLFEMLKYLLKPRYLALCYFEVFGNRSFQLLGFCTTDDFGQSFHDLFFSASVSRP